jgi:hypothetical protein
MLREPGSSASRSPNKKIKQRTTGETEMRTILIRAAMAASLALVPTITMAQNAGTPDSSSSASMKMKGPPNANGVSSGDAMQSDQATTGRSESSGTQMKGPPNADGAPGARGPNGSQ